jgi:hypothetical protein
VSRHSLSRALIAIVVSSPFGGPGIGACRADLTIASIEKDDNGMISSGGFTYSFFTNDDGQDTSVTSDTFDNRYVVAAANVGVTVSGGMITFTFNPVPTLSGATSTSDSVTINYAVSFTSPIAAAGLSFVGSADGAGATPASTTVTEMLSTGQMLKVFTDGNGGGANNQSTSLPDLAMMLTVTDVGALSIPTRGAGATSNTSLTSETNTFAPTPEPSSFVVAASSALAWLSFHWHRHRRVPARA